MMTPTLPLPKTTPDIGAVTQLTLTVFRLHGALLEWGDSLVEPLGLSSARWQMLGAIALADKPLTAPQIGAAMGVTRQGAQKQLNLLLELALVVAHANPAHLRSPLYALTADGRALYEQAEALWAERAAQLAPLIASEQLDVTQDTLETLLRHVTLPRPAMEAGS